MSTSELREATARPITELLKFNYTVRQENAINSMEAYQKVKGQNGNNIYVPLNVVHSTIYSMFLLMYPMLKRSISDEALINLRKLIDDKKNYLSLESAFYIMAEALDTKDITRVDTVKTKNLIDVGVD